MAGHTPHHAAGSQSDTTLTMVLNELLNLQNLAACGEVVYCHLRTSSAAACFSSLSSLSLSASAVS